MKKLLIVFLLITPVLAQERAATQSEWIKRSDAYTAKVNGEAARFGREGMQASGMQGLDDQIIDLVPKIYERIRQADVELLAQLNKDFAAEKDPLVRQDL